MSGAEARQRRDPLPNDRRPEPPFLVIRTYQPDLQRQVEALLLVLRARPVSNRGEQP